jgi:hypothetical protein
MEKSKRQLRDKIVGLAKFWSKYGSFYNASKHGGRYWLTEVGAKRVQEAFVGVQWLRKDRSGDTLLAESDELEDEVSRLADSAKSIMSVLHSNRVLVWSSKEKVNPEKYRHL